MVFSGSNKIWGRMVPVLCIIACLSDFVSLIFFAHLYPGYDPMKQPISALGASQSPIAGLVSAWWILTGLVFLMLAFTYWKSGDPKSRINKITSWLIAIYAICEEAGSGVFPGNHLNHHLTTIGMVHNIVGGFGLIALAAIPYVLMKDHKINEHPFLHRFAKTVAWSGILFFLLFSITRFETLQIRWLSQWHGLWQRLFIANYYLFLIVISIHRNLDSHKN
jgi:hypothetical membrane protein